MLGHDYIPIAMFTLLAISFPTLTFFMGRFFRPSNDNPLKRSTYECGETPIGDAHIQFHFQYYMFAILFVVFDIVTVFVLLWMVAYSSLTFEAKAIMGIFMMCSLIGLWYALSKEDVIWI